MRRTTAIAAADSSGSPVLLWRGPPRVHEERHCNSERKFREVSPPWFFVTLTNQGWAENNASPPVFRVNEALAAPASWLL